MTTAQEDCLFNSFARYQNAYVSSPLCSIQHEAEERYPILCAKSTNRTQKWMHYDGADGGNKRGGEGQKGGDEQRN
jgi:hypothetical protein